MVKKNKKSEGDSHIHPKETNKNRVKQKKRGNKVKDKEQRGVSEQQDERQFKEEYAGIEQNGQNKFEELIEQKQEEQQNRQCIEIEQQNIGISTNFSVHNQSNSTILALNPEYSYRILNKENSRKTVKVLDGVIYLNGQFFFNSSQPKILSQYAQIVFKAKSLKNPQQISFHSSITAEQIQFMNVNRQKNRIILLVDSCAIHLEEVQTQPWLNLPNIFNITPSMTLLVGPKNSGKSTLCEYLSNTIKYADLNELLQNPFPSLKINELCILDCDLGRNQNFPGCLSLRHIKIEKAQNGKKSQFIEQNTSLWIGQLTPLNKVPLYLKALHKLYSIYRQKYFTCHLLINTMGYLTGIGELVLYETFHILKPQATLFLTTEKAKDSWLKNIRKNIESGDYLSRMYFNSSVDTLKQQTTTKFIYHYNSLSRQKNQSRRFLQFFGKNEEISLFQELIRKIGENKMAKIPNNYEIFRQDQSGTIQHVEWVQKSIVNMQLVILGKFACENLFEVRGFGYGWNSQIFCEKGVLKDCNNQILMVLLSEQANFDKNFYQISESKLIELQELLGQRIPYILPSVKVLGNKGMRNYGTKK